MIHPQRIQGQNSTSLHDRRRVPRIELGSAASAAEAPELGRSISCRNVPAENSQSLDFNSSIFCSWLQFHKETINWIRFGYATEKNQPLSSFILWLRCQKKRSTRSQF